MRNRDMKDYRASSENARFGTLVSMLIVVALLAVLAWAGERDHQARIKQVKFAAQCGVKS